VVSDVGARGRPRPLPVAAFRLWGSRRGPGEVVPEGCPLSLEVSSLHLLPLEFEEEVVGKRLLHWLWLGLLGVGVVAGLLHNL
jgi:hypothetical protein